MKASEVLKGGIASSGDEAETSATEEELSDPV